MQIILLAMALLCPMLASAQQTIAIDANAPGRPFPHFWERMFGSGRANLMLRSAYADDLRAVKAVTGVEYVRGHGILDDENGVYTEDEHGNPVYNFAYVDQIYDGLLKQHVRPVVELSFMPKRLAFNPDALHPFWYKPNVSPPKSMERWDALIAALARNLIEHFGLEEVAQWYFEVWNEPNIDFWGGIPRDQSYFELYDHTARALKAVSPRLRVGGPATAAAHWADTFLAYTNAHHTPVDFISSHGYADDSIEDLFPPNETLPVPHPAQDTPLDDRVCLAVAKVRAQIDAAGHPELPLFWTEWNVDGQYGAFDTPFVGASLARTIGQCDGKAQMMSYWTFSDVFEEGGPIAQPFSGNFGLRAEYGVNKPSFYGFALLHELGPERLANASADVIVTRQPDHSLTIAAWNVVDPRPAGQAASGSHGKQLMLSFTGVAADAHVTISQVDETHSNVLPYYAALGKPQYLTRAQADALNRDTALPPARSMRLVRGQLTLTLAANELALIHVAPR